MSEFLISLDQGTTSTRAILYDTAGQKHQLARVDNPSTFPRDGWVEQDPHHILASSIQVLREVVAKADIQMGQLLGMGITNQRETTVIWDRATGESIYPAIVWQDKRTYDICQQLRDDRSNQLIQNKTGLLLDPYFSASKVAWILNNVSGAKEKALAGKLCFGTIETFLVWHLTRGKKHITDVTNASRTLLFNVKTLQWDDELLDLFEIPKALLPEVVQNVGVFASLDKSILGQSVPILSMMGDQQSASIGQGCIKPGDAKATYGTGCFLLRNTGSELVISNNQLISTIAYQCGDTLSYALEGSIFVAGALFKWMKNNLALFQDEKDIERLISKIETPEDLYFIPALSGLGAPFWDPKAKGAIFGLTQDTHIGHIIKAGLEGVCYQTYDLLDAFERDCQEQVRFLKVDGGMTDNTIFLQLLANCLHLDVHLSQSSEATAFGVFLLAATKVGVFNSLDEAIGCATTQKIFQPAHSQNSAKYRYQKWLKFVEKVKHDSI